MNNLIDINNHPCFNAEVRHKTGRIHLPVAPRCNVQCNFCNRKFDCANESRPGVTTSILKPSTAVAYLKEVDKRIENLAVIGIAGPGDPFANPQETMQTLEKVREKFPDRLLCVSSNGLSIGEYIPRLAQLEVSHVTITVNAVDPAIGAQIYEWVYFNEKSYYGQEGAQILLDKQTEAIRLLKEYGIIVKINSVVIPRVNEHHIHEVARYVAELGADVQNCIPLIPVEGTPFGKLEEPSPRIMRIVRARTAPFISQMSHCARCRADAVGLLGEGSDTNNGIQPEEQKHSFFSPGKQYIAVSSNDGIFVNCHLGEAARFLIYGFKNGKPELMEQRNAPTPQSHNRWEEVATILSDCGILLVNAVGPTPYEKLKKSGIAVEAVNGSINDITQALFTTGAIPRMLLRAAGVCGSRNSCGSEERECS
jgi:nitrogen fixation protein NifB